MSDDEPAGFDVIVRHLEDCLSEHGATPKGVDWPNGEDLAVRFETMLSMPLQLEGKPVVLDLGCGPGLLIDYLSATRRLDAIDYRGVDLSEQMVAEARRRWPSVAFEVRDIMTEPLPACSVDVVIMNGILTVRREVPRNRMIDLAQKVIKAAFETARVGVVFNVMSRHVDWERDDLFHWGFDEVAAYLHAEVSRHYSFRADYGLYEFATFVRREPLRPVKVKSPEWWVS